LLYGLTIFCGAFLLFLVQPLLGKYLLPWFGGGPGVWTVCLLFFQTALLVGYGYAHLISSRLRLRSQVVVHGALLALSCAFLPIIPQARWQPAPTDEPTLRILALLAVTVGLPYVVLAATGPLLQRWFTQTRRGETPYRLYALSNAGSLLALVAYPFGLEPLAARATQAWLWSGGMTVFALLCGACAWRVWREHTPGRPMENIPAEAAAASSERTPVRVVLAWLLLPAVASLLLAAVTQTLTSEVAPVPFLWVLPLAVYLLSFILCFDHPRWYARRGFVVLLGVGGVGVVYLLHLGTAATWGAQVATCLVVLFAACMVGHGEVYRLRPGPARLTGFYLCLAAGGAAGGFFVAVIAPRFFRDTYELQIGLCAALGVPGLLWLGQRESRKLGAFACVLTAALAAGFVQVQRHGREYVVETTRNFHGTMRLLDVDAGDPVRRHRVLKHGVTTHGAQFRAPELAGVATTYYGPKSGVGVALESLKTGPGRHVGVVGLGVGTLAAYGRAGDRFTFYEINPAVFAVAQSPFTYLKSCAARVDVVPGDARLSLQAEAVRGEAREFDVLVLDAFSGDAIPVHLLTAEAMELYLGHLKPGGIVAVHLSNRYLDLRGVVVGLSRRFSLDFVIVDDAPKTGEFWLSASRWCLLTRDKTLLRQWLPQTPEARAALEAGYHPVLWTDDHASLLSVLPR
jgi:SAM-dependent methyltransferase